MSEVIDHAVEVGRSRPRSRTLVADAPAAHVERRNKLSAARGLILGLAICAVFWALVALAWMALT